jgi:integrase
VKVADGIDALPSGHFRVRRRIAGKDFSKTLPTLEEAVSYRDAIDHEVTSCTILVGPSARERGREFLLTRSGNRNADTDRGRWDKHIAVAHLAQLPIQAVTRADVREWVAELKKKKTAYDAKKHGKRTPRPLSRQTRVHCLNLLRAFFAWAIENDLAPQNPCIGIHVAREDGDEDEGFQKDWFLTEDEWSRLYGLWDTLEGFDETDRMEKHIAAFAVGTGLRQMELACLHLDDVNVGDEEPHVVVRFGSYDRVRQRFRSPKGRTGSKNTRKVPLFGLALDAARAWLEVRSIYAPKYRGDLMFPTRRGALRMNKPPRTWKAVVKAFGVLPRMR